MAKAFDTSLKFLLEQFPLDWLRLAGVETRGPVEIIDADLSTVAPEADKVFRVLDPGPQLVHMELQASYDTNLPGRCVVYNVLLEHRRGEAVRTIVVLLRPRADGPAMTGRLIRSTPDGAQYLQFDYHVIRVWELTVEQALAGGPGVWALAPLAGDASEGNLPQVVHELERRVQQDLDAPRAESLWLATYILMGMKYPAELTQVLMQRVRHMKESSTYQAIVEEGRREGIVLGIEQGIERGIERERRLLVALGSDGFGPPSEEHLDRIGQLADFDEIERLIRRTRSATSWDELFESE